MSARMNPERREIEAGARRWWRDLQPKSRRAEVEANGGSDRPGEPDGFGLAPRHGDPAALARLRRASFPAEAMAEEATLDLFRRLGLTQADYRRLPRIAVIAMVLAHVREDAPPRPDGRRDPAIRAVGRTSVENEDSAALKPLRFRRLLGCRDDDDDGLAREMRRLVALAGRRINVGDLAASLFFWNEGTRTRWAFDYFAAGFAAPAKDARDAEGAGNVAEPAPDLES